MNTRRESIAWIPRAAVLLALFSIGSSGGCDWFDEPLSVNLPPSTAIVSCPQDVTAGDDVTIEWEGSDVDGSVVEYSWSFDERSSGTTDGTSLTLEDVSEGEHRFEVVAVDDDGDRDPTPAVCEFTASEAGGLVGRVVLVEFITTQPCSNCPFAEEALNVLLGDYGPDSLCVVSYHDLQPPVDPVATPESVARIDWYTDTTELPENTWPIAVFDGEHERAVIGAQSVNWCVSNYGIEIDRRRSIGTPLSIRLDGAVDGTRGDVTVTVLVRDPLPAGDYVLRTVVIEDDLFFPPDHDFGHVARDLLDDEPLTVSAVGDSAVVQRSFTVDAEWAVENVDVIAFVQNDDTKEVVQAGRLNSSE